MGVVDVREVSFAHLQAIKVPDAANKRFILSSEVVWLQQIAESLAQEFP